MVRSSIATLLLVALTASAGELAIGSAIPHADTKLRSTSEKMASIADVKGEKATVVAFWCNHCPYVVKYRQRLIDLANAFQDKGVGFIAINSNDPKRYPRDSFEAMKKSAERYKYSFPYVVDAGSKLAKAFGAARTPHIFIFDAAGKLVFVGAIDDSPDESKASKRYVKDWLTALVKGKQATVSNSRAFGCSIKWY